MADRGVEGIDLDELEDQYLAFEVAVAAALNATMRKAMREGAVESALSKLSLDDLNVIPPLWMEQVPGLAEDLVAIYVQAARAQAAAYERAGGVVIDEIADDVAGEATRAVRRFTTQHQEALDYLAQAPNRLAGIGDELWNDARQELLTGLDLGEDIPKIAERVRKVTGVTESKATMIARSYAVGASNAGSIAFMRSTGEGKTKKWLCVAGDTPVLAPSAILAGSRREFHGPLVTVRTASGRRVSLTPNHEVITTNGWVCAGDLNRGDQLIQVLGIHPATAPDIDDRPSLIGQVVDAAMSTGPVQVWPMFTGVDFDGNPTHGEVEVVLSAGGLLTDLESNSEQMVPHLKLMAADLLADAVCLGVGNLDLVYGSLGSAAGSSRRSGATEGDGLGRVTASTDTPGLTLIANRNSGFSEDSNDGWRRAPEEPSAVSSRMPVGVATDEIVSVEISAFRGHVYDLWTEESWYTCDGLVVHNSHIDDRTRPAHKTANGQEVDLEAKFTVGGVFLDHPGDHSGPAVAWANCRCVMTFGLIPIESTPELVTASASELTDRIVIVGGPLRGKSTLAAQFAEHGYPVFCGDPRSTVREPIDGVTYLPEDLEFSGDGGAADWVATNWLTMDGPWVCEGHVMARALRRWVESGQDPGAAADRVIVIDGPAWVESTLGQEAMHAAVMTVWGQIAHLFDAEDGGSLAASSAHEETAMTMTFVEGPTDVETAALVAAMDPEQTAPWEGVLCVEGQRTGDHRAFEGISWGNLPMPLRWNQEDSHGGMPTTKAVLVGRIDAIEKRGAEIWGTGLIDLGSENGREVHRLMGTPDAPAFLSGVSIDADDPMNGLIEVEFPAGCDTLGEGATPDQMIRCSEPELVTYHDIRIRAATLVDIPAIVTGQIYLTGMAVLVESDDVEEIAMAASANEPTMADVVESLTAAAATIVIPDLPPAWWFEQPETLPDIGAISITDEGRLFGLVAPGGVAHRGMPKATYAPKGNVDYSKWANRPVRVTMEDGTVGRIAAGPITMACGHPSATGPLSRDAAITLDMYDNSCSVFATACIGEDRKGNVWIAGAVLPDVTSSQLARALACQLSGDWRPHRERKGWREFCAALIVPVPAFATAGSARVSMQADALVASASPIRFAGDTECASCAMADRAASLDSVNAARILSSKVGRDPVSRAAELRALVKG